MKIPDTPIYCTANAIKSLKGQYDADWDFHVVKTGTLFPSATARSLCSSRWR